MIMGRIVPGGIGFCDAIIVDAAFRGRWANVAIRREGWRRCLDVGLHTVLYYTHARHRDTRHFVDKVGTVTREFLEPYRMLTGRPPGGGTA